MNDLHASGRLRLLFFAVLAVTFALGSFWILAVMRGGIDNTPSDAARAEPDYFVEQFNFVRASKIGQARYAISGARLTHFPKQDNYEIILPVMKSLSTDRPSIDMRAQRAIANSDASQVQMFDDVHIDRPESKGAPHFHLKSEYMLIFPDDDMMQTDKAVDIAQGGTEITGEGMVANNATLIFTLARNVHSITQPPIH